jgi:hypothetical protein
MMLMRKARRVRGIKRMKIKIKMKNHRFFITNTKLVFIRTLKEFFEFFKYM